MDPSFIGSSRRPGDEGGPTLQRGLAAHAVARVELADFPENARRIGHDGVEVDVLGGAVEQAAERQQRARVPRDVGVLRIGDDAPAVRKLAPDLEKSGEGIAHVLADGAEEQPARRPGRDRCASARCCSRNSTSSGMRGTVARAAFRRDAGPGNRG